MKQLFRHIAIPILFLVLFIGYQICITSFTHAHYVNGVLISHSHPFTDDGHSHQKAEFIFIAHLSHFSALSLELPKAINVIPVLLSEMDICWVTDVLPNTIASYFRLRAPPVVL